MLDARQSSFYSYTHFEEGEFSVQIQKKYLKRPLVGTVRKRPFHHRGLYSNHHLASCRHLRYIELFPHSHHLPWGSSGSTHPTKGGLDASPLEVMCISPREVMCIKYYRKLKIIWSSMLNSITIVVGVRIYITVNHLRDKENLQDNFEWGQLQQIRHEL